MDTFDAIVVGAGIVGSSAARAFAREGWRVAVVEGSTPAGGATAAGMGHIVVMDDSAAQLGLTAYSQKLWLDDLPVMPAAVEFEQCGTLWVAADDEEMAEVERKLRIYEQAGTAARILSAAELRAAEPNLRRNLAGALLVPGDGVIYPPAAAAFYLAEARRQGAKVFHERATRASDGEVLLEGGQALRSERIVLAVGAQSHLLPALPIQKRKGHLAITDRYPGFVRHQLVELGYLKSAHQISTDSVAFNVQPRQTGQILIGSSRQYGVEEPSAEREMLRRMLDRALEYMPGLGTLAVVRVWTGFRAATVDKLPLIGSARGLSDDPSLWLSAGFEGLGITNAPGAAQLLLDGMLGRPSAIDPSPYLPERFAGDRRPAYA